MVLSQVHGDADEADGLLVELDTGALGLGLYEDVITLTSFSTLAGFADVGLDPISLTLRINVRDSAAQVPLPATFWLFLTGLAGVHYRRRAARRNAR